ncbi:MAG TPA: restriction endonuclease subunit S [Ktedonobacteraceae bacterium]|nr:restriction endonuclease subunit S [Ktedonobacteraceae bacterium]
MQKGNSLVLLDICELIVDCEHKTAPTQPEGYPSIRTPNIGKGRLILDGVNRVSEETYKQWTQRAVPQAGDLILAREAPIGNVAIIPNNIKVCLGQRTVLIRPNKKLVEPNYLVYFLLGNEMQSKIHSLSNGATVHHLNMQDIRNLSLPDLPPLPTQRIIASILSAYDDLIENNTRRIALLEEMAQLLYQEWFVKFRFPGYEEVRMVETEMGMVPEGWEVVSFFDIANVLSGGTPKTAEPAYWNGDIPFYTPKDAPSSFFVIMTEKSLTEMGLKSCNSHLYPRNTVFISARGTVGRIALNAIAMAMNQSCYALEGRGGISQFFIFLHLKNCIRQLKQTANGAVFEAIIVDTFKWLQVLKPPLALIGAFTTMIAPVFDQILNLTMRNANLRRTRDMLLPKLVGGEIDVLGWGRMGAEADAINRVGTEVGVYEMRVMRGRRVAEARGMAQVEPMGQDDLEWRSLWEQ